MSRGLQAKVHERDVVHVSLSLSNNLQHTATHVCTVKRTLPTVPATWRRSSPMHLDLAVGGNVGQLLEKLMVDVDWKGPGTGLLHKKLLHPSIHNGG